LNVPKALSFSGIIKARKKEITIWKLQDIEMTPEIAGAKGSPTIVDSFGTLETRRSVQILAGTVEEKAEALVSILANAGAIG